MGADGRVLWDRRMPLLQREARLAHVHPSKEVGVERMRSFSELLAPRIDAGDGLIGLRDLHSAGRFYDIVPIPSEAAEPGHLERLEADLAELFCDLMPQRTVNPWVLQFFVYDSADIRTVMDDVRAYAGGHGRDDRYGQAWLEVLSRHFDDMVTAGGVFRGDAGEAWRVRLRRQRMCVWRRRTPGEAADPADNMDSVCRRIENAFMRHRLRLVRRTAGDLHDWLQLWFDPQGEARDGAPWCPDLADADIARGALRSAAPSSDADGLWWFRGRPARFITIDAPTAAPQHGHLTAERDFGGVTGALWDQMPAGCCWSMAITFREQDGIADHIKRIRHNAIGADARTLQVGRVADEALSAMAQRRPIFPVFCGVFVTGQDVGELDRRCGRILAILSANGLSGIAPHNDPIAQDSYIRALPFCYDPDQDRRWFAKRARLYHAEHIVSLMPLLGRSVGTGNPGLLAFNRGGEPLAFDPLNRADRTKNAHALILGPTGSGKTSWLIGAVLQQLAMRRPRIFLITALPTFGLMAAYCERLGIRIVRRSIDEAGSVTLPPFTDAGRLDERRDDGEAQRDLLGEMEIIARLMVTGGDAVEEERLGRDGRGLLRAAIEQAGKDAGGRDVMTSDVVSAIRRLAGSHEGARREEALRMADAMNLFCTGADGAVFDAPGTAWPEADITVVELGYYARKDYEDRLAVAVTGMMLSIQNEVERKQHTRRQTIVVVDEAHVLLQNPLISPHLARIVATWRTYGAWLWLATQNLRQFPEEAGQLLGQPEWWVLLGVGRDDLDQIGRFRSLTDEQRAMIASAQPRPGIYAEGTVISSNLLNLFRSVPPPVALALAQTEKDEKADRARLMAEHGMTELEAVGHIAGQIRAARVGL